MHISVDAVPFSFVALCELVKLCGSTGYAIWKKADESSLIEAQTIIDVLLYTVQPDGMIGTIVPIEFR